MKKILLFFIMFFSFNCVVFGARSNSEFRVKYDYTSSDYSNAYDFITNYNHFSTSYIYFVDGSRQYICYDPYFNEFGSSGGNTYSLDCSKILLFNTYAGVFTNSVWKSLTPQDSDYNNRAHMITDIGLLYAHDVNISSLNLSNDLPINFVNSGSSVNSDFNDFNDIYVCASNSINFRGLLNILYESQTVQYSYTINYYFNDEIDSSLTINSTDEANATISIPNYSNNEFSVDNNVYNVSLTEDNMVFNIYYYDVYFGTDYELIDTSNTHIPFNFSVRYLNNIFNNINFNRFTQFEQFVICILINILFILFIWFIIHFIRIAFAYLMRLF